MSRKKPRLNQRSLPWLIEIDEALRDPKAYRGDPRPAASDALDGHATRAELDELIRRRFLEVIPAPEEKPYWPVEYRERCGTVWSVQLTPRAVRTFWPERAEALT
ncbi:hypothetical protein CKO28_20540 [Rhodovibrio sodomensis]|uniref:Uncharacterized protein n=1 Tax=Rhodovibrio sodomensis TaxID=1088 RepID=A0ABS1DKA7_9PROT|nr:hypothetical protein [Rhodovibrio sodomensis]MBK1670416.1 hypothetical protein [Rhodovibrio sodomensis]